MNKLCIVGIGSGNREDLTIRAWEALSGAEVIIGYARYVEQVKRYLPDKRFISSGMRREEERCREAIRLAETGARVALISSGDPGIYGMASPALELAEGREIEIEIIPGVTSALSGAALLGAPLGHDAALISLSDVLTPWEAIEARIRAAASSGCCIALYNPGSAHRPDALRRACGVLLQTLAGETVCGMVSDIGGAERTAMLPLSELADMPADMRMTVFVGNGSTRVIDGRMVTPRGYVHG